MALKYTPVDDATTRIEGIMFTCSARPGRMRYFTSDCFIVNALEFLQSMAYPIASILATLNDLQLSRTFDIKQDLPFNICAAFDNDNVSTDVTLRAVRV